MTSRTSPPLTTDDVLYLASVLLAALVTGRPQRLELEGESGKVQVVYVITATREVPHG